MIDEMLKWADWSLKGLDEQLCTIENEKKVILHGDVAHHNFIRNPSGTLCLIDFDLISIGYRSADYLQYANRILPYLNWSLDELEKINVFKPYLLKKGFLYGLAYPTDIFREWNRLIRERQYHDPTMVRQLLDLTVEQFVERQKFVRDLKEQLDEKGIK